MASVTSGAAARVGSYSQTPMMPMTTSQPVVYSTTTTSGAPVMHSAAPVAHTVYPTHTTTTTGAYSAFPQQQPSYTTSVPASTTIVNTGTASTPVVTSSAPVYTSYASHATTHQVYHPENAEIVHPPRSLRGGMKPLYDMHQVRTYEAAPVFHAAPFVVEQLETVQNQRGVEEASGHRGSVASEDAGTKKKHASGKHTQGKKKFCC
eukprot:Protomagalhaensia_sp_Gyna_25__3215@NODE_2929_length_814_cov_5_741935_g2446_i0_p1_GENE_NODE_2929_length_814_cov_5_741935_g2446_i0NODE_2929_length_814_cov_5_741935_g2446_i0_p1_ORF_typecomplete_len206_score21_91_NODE_2929_length_814_cov_5_741935_g2446_i093710